MKKYLALVLALALLTASVSAVAAAPNTKAKAWTYLVYMGADNNLDTWGDFSLDLMEIGLTSDQDVSVAVLYDHYGANADLLQVTSAGVVKLADYGEPDMGNPETLRQFLSWGVQAFPANHYAVVLWSHGGGWKYIIKDSTSGTRMSIAGLESAMSSVVAELGRGDKFDITLFDACLMSLVEVADQLTHATDYVVASEQSVNYTGFPYDLMLQRLVANPSVSSGDYAQGIADDYYVFNVQSNSKSVLSVSAIDESDITMIFVERNNVTVKVSWRASKPHIDVSEIAVEFGGGGHKAAAGAEVDGNMSEVQERVLAATRAALAKQIGN